MRGTEVGVSLAVLEDTGDYVRLARSRAEVLQAPEVRLAAAPAPLGDAPAVDLQSPAALQYCKAQLGAPASPFSMGGRQMPLFLPLSAVRRVVAASSVVPRR